MNSDQSTDVYDILIEEWLEKACLHPELEDVYLRLAGYASELREKRR